MKNFNIITMPIQALLIQLNNTPEQVQFTDVISVIEKNYQYTPVKFTNGDVINEAGTNEGSCKIFAFAQLNNLSEQATLACFGKYYREDVLQHPDATDHGNIRNFIKYGWQGVKFSTSALILK